MGRKKLSKLILVSLLFIIVSDTSMSEHVPYSGDSISEVDRSDQNTCIFRQSYLRHGYSIRLDECTVCTCDNATTTCEIKSCPPEAGCSPDEFVVIAGVCCSQCPYKMFVQEIINLYGGHVDFIDGDSKNIKFNLDVEVSSHLTSSLIRGGAMWKLNAWISPKSDGSGEKYSVQDNVFTELQANKQYIRYDYPTWVWKKIQYNVEFRGGSCEDYKYFCVKFNKGDNPLLEYDLSFTFQAVDNEENRLISCVPLGECFVKQIDRNPCTFNESVLYHGNFTRPDPCTICTCINATITCEPETCPQDECDPNEIVDIDQECCPQCPNKMFVTETNNLYGGHGDFTEGDLKSIKFALDVVVDRTLTSRYVRGESLWKLTAWISPNSDGSGDKYSVRDNVFTESHANKQFTKEWYPPWLWKHIRYNMEFRGGSCEDYRYFCVKFNKDDKPYPKYDLGFTFQAIDNEEQRLISCVRLGECSANEYNQHPCTLQESILSHGNSIQLDKCTMCTCTNATITCKKEICPRLDDCNPDEAVVKLQECCSRCPVELQNKGVNVYLIISFIIIDVMVITIIGIVIMYRRTRREVTSHYT